MLRIGGMASGHVGDVRSFSSAALRSDWTYEASPRLSLDSGMEASDTEARFHYGRVQHFSQIIANAFGQPPDSALRANTTPEETAYAGWAAARRRWASFEAELGVRFDAQQYARLAARQEWSPRVNLRYDVAARWHLYGSWGHFSQAQRPEEWRVEEAQVAPDLPELAIHSTLGVAYESSANTRFGLEGYRKRWTNVSPYYGDILGTLTLVPDLMPDRVRIAPIDSRSEGVELSARHTFSPALEGWANYTWSNVIDDVPGAAVLRSWDQPHAVTSGLSWTRGRLALETVVGWHRGWPRTPFAFGPPMPGAPGGILIGSRNSSRWGNYFTLDLRSSWTIAFGRSDFSIWAEATNGTNRSNPCCDRLLSAQTAIDAAVAQPDSFRRAFDIGFIWRFRDRR
jgi:outer membrane receptor protein involved in Fe transport